MALSHVAEVVALVVLGIVWVGLLIALVDFVLEGRSQERDERMRDYYAKNFRRLP